MTKARVPVPDHVRHEGPLPTVVESASAARRGRLVTGAVAVLLAVAIGYVVFGPKGGGGGEPFGARATAAPAATTSRPVEAARSGVRMPVGDLPGWRQTFADDFADGIGRRWHVYDGAPAGEAGYRFVPEQVSAGNGLLTVTASRSGGNVYRTGGLCNSNVFTQTYGRYEIRFRMERGYGIGYALRLLPTVELPLPQVDVLEDSVGDRAMAAAVVRQDGQRSPVSRSTKGDFTAWHTAAVVWTPAKLDYLIDGHVWATVQNANVPAVPMSITIRSWVTHPNASTPERVKLDVDWVVAYAATG